MARHDINCVECGKFILAEEKERNTGNIKCLLRYSSDDKEWTRKRNEGLTGVFYHKITFLPEIQGMVCKKLDEYIRILKVFGDEISEEEQKEKEEREKRKKEWSCDKEYSKILPTGGENGRDGFIDAEYISEHGETVRMISRDVFDFGCYSYPQRLSKSENMLEIELWTEPEKQLAMWLAEFGAFRGIRM